MGKKIGGLLLCMIAAGSLYAENEFSKAQSFVGAEIGYTTAQGDVIDFFGNIKSHELSNIEYGIRLGAQAKVWRVTLALDDFDKEEDGYRQRYVKGLLSLDYLLITGLEKFGLKPYLGLNGGYTNYKTTAIDKGTFVYGGQAGVVWNIAQRVDIDLMYRYTLGESALDHVEGAVFGINYLLGSEKDE